MNLFYSLVFAGLFAAPAADDEVSVQSHMFEHFARATLIQTAVINGKLEDAKQHAEWLALHVPHAELPTGWEPFVDRMQATAGDISAANSLIVAADATADLAGICGECHQALAFTMKLDSSSHAPMGNSVPSRMARHLWAADRLWEGLIGPNEEAWIAGAEALAEAPLRGDDIRSEGASTADYLADRVNGLGADARRTARHSARVRLYGHLLSTCAECHDLYRNR